MPEPPRCRPLVRGREQGSVRRAPAPRALPGSAPSPTPRSASAPPRRGAPPLGLRGGLGRAASAQRAHCGRPARRRRRRHLRQRAGTLGVAPTCPRPAPLPHAGGAPPCPRARAAALGRVRGVRWRWGRREPELSQAPRPPERAKWGVMAAGGSGCTSSAGSGGWGVSPRRTGRCVRICVWRARGGEAGVGSRAGVTLVPSAESGRLATGALPWAAGAWTGAPGRGRAASCTSHTVCFVCFSLPRSRFPLCSGRRDHKGLTHIFNPPPKSKWPVWCLLHPPPPSFCPSLCLTLMSPALLFPRLCFGAADVWGNALSSVVLCPPRPVLREARNSSPPC